MKTKLIAIATAFILAGCATKKSNDDFCLNAAKVVQLYEASLTVREPSEEETRIYTAARAVLILQCGQPGTVQRVTGKARSADGAEQSIGTIPVPRQPQRIVVEDQSGRVIYYLHTPFSIVQDPTGVYRTRSYGLATITTGPLYRTANPARKMYLWMPDEPYLRGWVKTPTMSPIR